MATEQALVPASENGLAGLSPEIMEKLVVGGDLSRLDPGQRLTYYRARCEAAGVDPRTHPFKYLSLSGKLVLYADKGCTEQLASKHGIVLEIVSQATEDKLRIVNVRARTKDGRQTDEIGVVPLVAQDAAGRANEYMKAVTKAKRRAVLSICGLGLMDETEIETVRGANPVEIDAAHTTLAAMVIEPGDDVFSNPKREPTEAEAEVMPPLTPTVVLGIPISVRKDWQMVRTAPIMGKSKYAKLTWGQLLDAGDPSEEVEWLESGPVRAAQAEWGKIAPQHRAKGQTVIPSYQYALITFDELQKRRSPPPADSGTADFEPGSNG